MGAWERTQEQAKRSLLVRTLKKAGMNKNRAARLLGIDPRYIRRLLKKFGLAVILFLVACNQDAPAPPPRKTYEQFKIEQLEADWRRLAVEMNILQRRLNHVCPEAFPLPNVATTPLTNTTPKPLTQPDLLRYNRCAEASGIAH